ncbi:hypothetical protein D3C71_1059220 [compost metagenome]
MLVVGIAVARFQGVVGIPDVARRSGELVRCPGGLEAEAPFIGTALAQLVDHTAGGTAIACAVTAGIGFLLIDRAVGQTDTADVVQRIGRIEAIEVVGILGNAGAAKGQYRARAVGEETATTHHARCQQCDGFGGAAQRQHVQLLGGDDRLGHGVGDVDLRHAGRGDGHGIQRGGTTAAEGDFDTGANLQLHVFALLDRLAVALQRHGVDTHRQRAEVVAAIGVDRGGALEAGFVLNGDGGTCGRGGVAIQGAGGALGGGCGDDRGQNHRERGALQSDGLLGTAHQISLLHENDFVS